jgi:pyridoxine kinase
MAEQGDAILAIQSQVACGYVGNSAAALPLQRLGFEVFAINTVQLAHHPGYGAWRGHRVESERIAEILSGLEDHGALGRCAGVLSGYLGAPEVGGCVLRALEGVRAARPDAIYLCDPVIGDDDTGIFVAPGIPELMRDRLAPAADIVTPNRFELAWLAGIEIVDLDSALAATSALRARGTGTVVATGLLLPDRPGELCVVADAADGAWLVRTPHHASLLHGTGDVFSALLLGHRLRTGSLPRALERAVSAMSTLVERTVARGRVELDLVGALDAFVAPEPVFRAQRLE